MAVKLLSHDDFKKVLQWTLIQSVQGSYAEQIEREIISIQETKAIYGYVPKTAHDEINDLRKNWARPALNSKSICVDITTGEVYDPSDL